MDDNISDQGIDIQLYQFPAQTDQIHAFHCNSDITNISLITSAHTPIITFQSHLPFCTYRVMYYVYALHPGKKRNTHFIIKTSREPNLDKILSKIYI